MRLLQPAALLLGVVLALSGPLETARADDGTPPIENLHFIGLTIEVDFTADLDAPVRSFLTNDYFGLGASYGYGRGWFRPRARLNIGWLSWQRFYPTLGVELPLVEVLSDAGSKLIGLYVTADAGWAFGGGTSFVYRITPLVRLPLGLLEGIGLGASYRSDNGWSLFVGRIAGGYPRL